MKKRIKNLRSGVYNKTIIVIIIGLFLILIGMNYKLFITQYTTQDDLLNHPVYEQLLTDNELIKVQNYGSNFRNAIIKDYFDVALNLEIDMAKEYVKKGDYLKMNNDQLYASVVERFGVGVELFQNTCPGLVGQIEKGDLDSNVTRAILEDALFPMLEKNIDTVVLGCTHYPFVIPLIKNIVGESVRVIDPAPSVARQAKRLLEANKMINATGGQARIQLFTSGDAASMKSLLPLLLGKDAEVESVMWKDDREIQ